VVGGYVRVTVAVFPEVPSPTVKVAVFAVVPVALERTVTVQYSAESSNDP
jgi:hypothetical protein